MKKIILLFALIIVPLAGCAQVHMPHLWGNEVPEGAVNAPRLVATPTPGNSDTWPRLGDVPSKPNNFSPPPVIDQARSEMEHDRAEADDLRRRVEQP